MGDPAPPASAGGVFCVLQAVVNLQHLGSAEHKQGRSQFMASVQTEVRELVDAIRSEGFQCAIERDGHWHIYRHGRPVLKQHGGPVTLPSSPSDARWRDNTIAMLRD